MESVKVFVSSEVTQIVAVYYYYTRCFVFNLKIASRVFSTTVRFVTLSFETFSREIC